MKEVQVIDLEKECAYQPWTPEVTARVDNWIAAVASMVDPKSEMVTEVQSTVAVQETESVVEAETESTDFPF